MVIELKTDTLSEYMSEERLLVIASTNWCNACTKLKPYLYKIGDEICKIIIIDGEKHLRSLKFIPGKIKGFPTIGYFEKGYYIGEISQLDIMTGLKNKQI